MSWQCARPKNVTRSVHAWMKGNSSNSSNIIFEIFQQLNAQPISSNAEVFEKSSPSTSDSFSNDDNEQQESNQNIENCSILLLSKSQQLKTISIRNVFVRSEVSLNRYKQGGKELIIILKCKPTIGSKLIIPEKCQGA